MPYISEHTKQLHIQRWQESGLSISLYSEKAGIPSSTMRGWVKKVKDSPDSAPHFIELSGLSDETKASRMHADTAVQHAELVFPSGLTLKIYG